MRFFSDVPDDPPDVPPPAPRPERHTVDLPFVRPGAERWTPERRPDITRPPTPSDSIVECWDRRVLEPPGPNDAAAEASAGLTERFARDLEESIPEAVIWRTVAVVNGVPSGGPDRFAVA